MRLSYLSICIGTVLDLNGYDMKFKELTARIYRQIKLVAVRLVIITIALSLLTANAEAVSGMDITVYRDPSCSCCGGWIDYLAAQGFNPQTVMADEMETVKQQQGVPSNLASCHTAIIDGYVVEGHVPVEDIKRLLAEHPSVKGIAVPGMPIGTPGMESGEEHDSFTVVSFDQQGNTKVFNQHLF
jgi:hypothetical protein